MKKFLLGSALAIVSTGTAFATDLPARVPAQIYKAAPAYSWTGLYGGISGGYAWGENTISDDAASLTPSGKFKPEGGFGGVQIGYKNQFNPHWMVGGQIDLSAGDVKGSLTTVDTLGENKFNTFGTARTTFGYVQDRALLYGTAGAIWLRDRYTALGAANNTDSSQYHVGWVFGGGIEYAIDTRWSFNLEYLYAPLDRSHDRDTGGNVRTFDPNFSIVRAGLNYRFSDGGAPSSYVPVKAPVAPASRWNGSYLGVHGGYGWSTLDKTDGSGPLTANLNPSGGYGGVGGGYNWVYAPNALIGMEIDSSFGDLKQTRTGAGITATSKVEDLGTARLRLGYLITPETLLYVTGGAAYAREKSTDNLGVGGDTKVDHLGWTAGAGAEYMFAPQWSLKAEWLYADLGKFTDNSSAPPTVKQSDMTLGTARIGINYYGPVIERFFNWK